MARVSNQATAPPMSLEAVRFAPKACAERIVQLLVLQPERQLIVLLYEFPWGHFRVATCHNVDERDRF